jgi:hypothetical protein
MDQDDMNDDHDHDVDNNHNSNNNNNIGIEINKTNIKNDYVADERSNLKQQCNNINGIEEKGITIQNDNVKSAAGANVHYVDLTEMDSDNDDDNIDRNIINNNKNGATAHNRKAIDPCDQGTTTKDPTLIQSWDHRNEARDAITATTISTITRPSQHVGTGMATITIPWSCHRCTYVNRPLALACEICSTTREILL